MNEAPKRIWIDNTILDEFDMELCPESDIPYIRADIVDELLKVLIAIGAGQGDPKAVAIQALESYMEQK